MAQRGQKGLAHVPSQPLCHTPPTLWLCCLLSPQGRPRKPLLKPSCLCLQQFPSISISEPSSEMEGGQSRGTQTNSPAMLGAALSLVHHALTRGMSSLPTPARAPAAPSSSSWVRSGLWQQHLPAQGRSRLQIQRQTGAWGLTQGPAPSRSSHQAQLGHW